MKMKTLILSIPAEATNGLSDADIKAVVAAALRQGEVGWGHPSPQRRTCEEVRKAVIEAHVHEFDDLREKSENGKPMCGPVFYIP